MTMHVGMVGSDGVVLAGDTLVSGDPRADSSQSHELGTWMSQTQSKIKVSDDRKIAVSCAGYLREAYPLADEIIAGLSDEFWEYPERRVQEIARSYAASRPRWRDTQSLILLSEPMSLYLLNCFTPMANEPLSPQCHHVPMYAFDGDALNPAIYWAVRYCRMLPPDMRTLHRLTRLAVQIISDGAALNSAGIGGLEVVRCDTAGIHQLTSRENEILLREAQQRSNQIQRLIIGE